MPSDPYSFANVVEEPENFQRDVGGPVGAAIASSRSKAAQLEIQQQRLAQQQENDAISNTLAIHKSAVSDAKAYYDLAKSTSDMATEAAQKLDAADFLSEAQQLDHSDPQYEKKVAALTAKYPLAWNDHAVSGMMGVKETARRTYMEGIKEGGAYEFEEDSPAFHKYVDAFKKTGDPNMARAAANHVKLGEEGVRKEIAEGYLTDEDIYEDPAKGKIKPDLHDENGYLHYDKLAGIAARKRAEVSGKPKTAEDKEVLGKRDFVAKYAGKEEDLKDSDPDTYNLLQLYKKDVLSHERKKRGVPEDDSLTPTSKPVTNLMRF